MKPGDWIGPYRIVGPLGSGGMGEVFAAVHERMGQPVALKLLTRVEPSCAARFIQEARILCLLDHPGVVRVLFLGETADRTPYLVLEQVAGRSLRELLREHPEGLPADLAVSLAAQVAATMAAVHQRGIVHRDLTPGNILVTPVRAADAARARAASQSVVLDEDDATRHGMVKVIDFGIARMPPPSRSFDDTLVETRDEAARWLGTGAYMAPEQCRRSGEVGPAADVYSLGVVLYEALCGRPPFLAEDPIELAALHLHAGPDLSRIGPGSLRRLIGAMLSKVPGARPSMAEVAAELARPARHPVDRRDVIRGLLAAAGVLLFLDLGVWKGTWPGLSRLLRGRRRDAASAARTAVLPAGDVPGSASEPVPGRAIDRPANGVSSLQMRPEGLILIAHMERYSVSHEEMLAALPPEYAALPCERVQVPVTAAPRPDGFTSAADQITEWFYRELEPLLRARPGFRVIYFGVAPIPLIFHLGWLVGPLPPVEVRLRHHVERRFVPWAAGPGPAQLLPASWSREHDDRPGDVAVLISTSHRMDLLAVRAAAPDVLAEVELRLAEPAEDAFASDHEIAAVVAAWRVLLDEVKLRFPRVQRVLLFVSAQAGVVFLLGTCVSRSMHPEIRIHHYQAGAFHGSLPVNVPLGRPLEQEPTAMDFQPLFLKFHDQIKLRDTEENTELRQRRDEVLEHLRRQMWERHRLRFSFFNSGSYAMGTGIVPQRGADYDIDVGVVFELDHATQDPRELKQRVFSGLASSLGRVEWRRPCITVFRRDHHLDLGIFAKDRGGLWLTTGKQTDPAVTWQQDGILLFIEDVRDRFPGSRGDHDQFKRTIRYLKRWKDVHFQGNGVKAPVGLALTVMAYRWFGARSRAGSYNDLAALTDLVKRIVDYFSSGQLALPFPRAPGDNLLRKLSAEQVRQTAGRFQVLGALLDEAAKKNSTAPLRRAFGADFPES